ncbi:unnamed protein product [Paramecium primaurelia]|uniref:Transmembrane protein n=1 Tax=Paramecium primaurelia TaxID=5886 RepID=A0A8S1P7U2_PARPR|nr:unnamed protein product [Paramecium primaurelia]
MLAIQIFILIVSTLFGLSFQSQICPDIIYDCVKLFIFSTLLIEHYWILIGLFLFIWLRELIKKFDPEKKLELPNMQQQLQQNTIQSSKAKLSSLSVEVIESAVEAVQIYDHVTGESQYAILQKADKSQLAQLGITLKNTVLLEKGRIMDSNQTSKLISQIDNQKKGNDAQQISIKYEDNSEYLRNQNRIQKSIPFKIGDFDQQMGEIIQVEILSNEQLDNQQSGYQAQDQNHIQQQIVFEYILLVMLYAGGISQVKNIYLQIFDSLLFGVVIHSGVQRQQLFTLTHFFINFSIILGCCIIYTLGIYLKFQIFIIGGLVLSFQKVNANLQMIIIPLTTLLKIFII